MQKFIKGVRRFTGGALAVIAVLAVAPNIAHGSEYGDAYKAYNEALAKGDTAAAITHAKTAWTAAEAALGDNATTGVLAYNYGQIVLFDDPEESLLALMRAKSLSDAGVAQLPVSDLGVYINFANFRAGGAKKQDAKTLHAALQARGSGGDAAPTYEMGRIWLALAVHQMSKRAFEAAQESAARAEADFAEVLPDVYSLQAQAILTSGAAMLSNPNATVDSLTAAHAEFTRAQELFPLQKDLDSFDPILAKVMAWDRLAHAALMSKESLSMDSVASATRKWPDHGPVFENQISEAACGVEWEKQRQPVYPGGARHKGYIGAVIIGYNIAEDGSVADERILAEIPDMKFGAYTVKAVGEWKRKLPLNSNPACQVNQLRLYSFGLREQPRPSEATDSRLD